MRIRFLHMLAVLVTVLVGFPVSQAHAAPRCFPETNHCIDGRIREYWEQNGGLLVFGFPIGDIEEVTIEGKAVRMQRFERNRLELHPENARPYDVLLGRLGADRLSQQGRDWFTFAKNGDTGGCQVFGETGHAVCGDILKMWKSNGLMLDTKKAVSTAESMALFGLPVSDLQTETMSDGKQYQVQWFERARFELHPENPAPYNVLLGLLGNEVGEFDYSLDDKPLRELTLNLGDFPSGMELTREQSYMPDSAAQNWTDPKHASELFSATGRLDSFTASFHRSLIINLDGIGADNVYTFVTHTRTIQGAKALYPELFSDVVKNEAVNSPVLINVAIQNVDQVTSFKTSSYKCDAHFQDGSTEASTCTYIYIYFRTNNLIGFIRAGGLTANIDLPTITQLAQKAADRMGR